MILNVIFQLGWNCQVRYSLCWFLHWMSASTLGPGPTYDRNTGLKVTNGANQLSQHQQTSCRWVTWCYPLEPTSALSLERSVDRSDSSQSLLVSYHVMLCHIMSKFTTGPQDSHMWCKIFAILSVLSQWFCKELWDASRTGRSHGHEVRRRLFDGRISVWQGLDALDVFCKLL